MYKNNKNITKLHAEINELKAILHIVVKEYGDLSHPVVVAVSNKLDQKIYACMRLLHTRRNK